MCHLPVSYTHLTDTVWHVKLFRQFFQRKPYIAVDNRANMRIMGNKNKNSSYFGGVQYAEIRRGDIGRRNGADVYKRQVMYLTGVSNIRDVELHPRTVGNAEF